MTLLYTPIPDDPRPRNYHRCEFEGVAFSNSGNLIYHVTWYYKPFPAPLKPFKGVVKSPKRRALEEKYELDTLRQKHTQAVSALNEDSAMALWRDSVKESPKEYFDVEIALTDYKEVVELFLCIEDLCDGRARCDYIANYWYGEQVVRFSGNGWPDIKDMPCQPGVIPTDADCWDWADDKNNWLTDDENSANS